MNDSFGNGGFPKGLEVPAPPDVLRARVLSAARQALLAELPDAWTRVVRSSPLRLAWASSVLLLLAANVFLPAVRRSEIVARTSPTVVDPEVEQIAKLPRIDMRLLQPEESSRVSPNVSKNPPTINQKGVLS